MIINIGNAFKEAFIVAALLLVIVHIACVSRSTIIPPENAAIRNAMIIKAMVL